MAAGWSWADYSGARPGGTADLKAVLRSCFLWSSGGPVWSTRPSPGWQPLRRCRAAALRGLVLPRSSARSGMGTVAAVLVIPAWPSTPTSASVKGDPASCRWPGRVTASVRRRGNGTRSRSRAPSASGPASSWSPCRWRPPCPDSLAITACCYRVPAVRQRRAAGDAGATSSQHMTIILLPAPSFAGNTRRRHRRRARCVRRTCWRTDMAPRLDGRAAALDLAGTAYAIWSHSACCMCLSFTYNRTPIR
jgi:hypothetical protein